jgi:penicillin-binding protein 2
LVSGLYYLQILNGEHNFSLAEGNRIRTTTIRAKRGIIYDRNKNQLTKNVPNFEISVTPGDLPKEEEKREKFYNNLAEVLKMNPQEIKTLVEEKKDSFESVVVKKDVDRETKIVFELKQEEFPQAILSENPSREYAEGSVYSHIIGYVGRIDEKELEEKKNSPEGSEINYAVNDYIGKTGLENYYEQVLHGKNGRERVEVDAQGKVVKVLASEESQSGENLISTLDIDLQKEVAKHLQEGIRNVRSTCGAAVALNPQTGEVLAMVSIPGFDNNLFASGISPQEYQNLLSDPLKPLFNRTISGTYPAGSTIKPVTACAGLQEGIISGGSYIYCPGVIKVPNKYNPEIIYEFPCWNLKGHGSVAVIDAIAQSCDVFFYIVGGGFEGRVGLGLEKLKHYMNLFGLGEKTGIDLPNEDTGLVPSEQWKLKAKGETWYQGDTYHLSIGQGDLLTTPLQVANFTAAVSNGGKLYKPQVVRQIIDGDGKTVRDFNPEVIRENFISQNNINLVRQGMRKAVTSGTASNLNPLPVPAAGKTGTAEYGPQGEKKHAWFTCFAPYDNPQIALVVLIEGGGEGNEVAVPVAKKILQYYFSR